MNEKIAKKAHALIEYRQNLERARRVLNKTGAYAAVGSYNPAVGWCSLPDALSKGIKQLLDDEIKDTDRLLQELSDKD